MISGEASVAIESVRRPTSRRRIRRGSIELPLRASGLIAIGGPPLGGKGLLTARLLECLPFSLRLEATDDLRRAVPVWYPDGPGGRELRNPTRALLARARQILEGVDEHQPMVVLVSARFATPLQRRRAKRMAQSLGMRFLFVEARSRDDRALRRIPMGLLTRIELQERLRRYDAALRTYEAVTRAESLLLPAVRVTRAVSSLEQAVDRVLGMWKSL